MTTPAQTTQTTTAPPATTTVAAAEFSISFEAEVGAIRALLVSNPSETRARIAALEKRIVDAQHFLPPYDLRVSLAVSVYTIADLSAQLSTNTATTRPKFSFSKKTATVKTKQEVPAALAFDHVAEPFRDAPIFSPPETATVIADRHDATIRPTASTVPCAEVYLFNLTNCFVDLRLVSPTAAVHVKNLGHCVVLVGAVKGSILLDFVKDSLLVIACRQFRMHNSSSTRILLHISSKPIIEDCKSLVFGAYTYATLSDSLIHPADSVSNHNHHSLVTWHELTFAADLGDEEGSDGRWGQVEDFNWLKQGESPNWRQVCDGEAVVDLGPGVNASAIANEDGNFDSQSDLIYVLREADRVKF
ncbi:hypothetical protein HK100_006507 [Physocladia obscura]|uniref:C-CAP/cofactor C-like domain-containing protein n=1 Tax=Physocladia obscura TaxID=109957 RepID=A0AAD5SQJ0_9FUNG|nr:hypothetical protein HK100_006507 [Physocladia obscura]